MVAGGHALVHQVPDQAPCQVVNRDLHVARLLQVEADAGAGVERVRVVLGQAGAGDGRVGHRADGLVQPDVVIDDGRGLVERGLTYEADLEELADQARVDGQCERVAVPLCRDGRRVHRHEVRRGVARERIEGLDEGVGRRRQDEIAHLGLEFEDPGLAHIGGGHEHLAVDVRLDEVPVLVVQVLVVAEDRKLIVALLGAALAHDEVAESGRGRVVRGGEGAVAVQVIARAHFKDVAVDQPAFVAQDGGAGGIHGLEVLQVRIDGERGRGDQADQRGGRQKCVGAILHLNYLTRPRVATLSVRVACREPATHKTGRGLRASRSPSGGGCGAAAWPVLRRCRPAVAGLPAVSSDGRRGKRSPAGRFSSHGAVASTGFGPVFQQDTRDSIH